MKKVLFFLIFLLAVWGSGFATTLGFSCIQNTDSPDTAVTITAALETELFELAFDYGVIATSMDYSLHGYEYYESNELLTKLFEPSADYLAVLYCEYESGKKESNSTQNTVVLKKLQWKLFDFSSQKILAEETIALETIEEQDSVQKARIAGKRIGLKILQYIQPQQ